MTTLIARPPKPSSSKAMPCVRRSRARQSAKAQEVGKGTARSVSCVARHLQMGHTHISQQPWRRPYSWTCSPEQDKDAVPTPRPSAALGQRLPLIPGLRPRQAGPAVLVEIRVRGPDGQDMHFDSHLRPAPCRASSHGQARSQSQGPRRLPGRRHLRSGPGALPPHRHSRLAKKRLPATAGGVC